MCWRYLELIYHLSSDWFHMSSHLAGPFYPDPPTIPLQPRLTRTPWEAEHWWSEHLTDGFLESLESATYSLGHHLIIHNVKAMIFLGTGVPPHNMFCCCNWCSLNPDSATTKPSYIMYIFIYPCLRPEMTLPGRSRSSLHESQDRAPSAVARSHPGASGCIDTSTHFSCKPITLISLQTSLFIPWAIPHIHQHSVKWLI